MANNGQPQRGRRRDGQTTVGISPAEHGGFVRRTARTERLGYAIQNLFDCKCFHSTRGEMIYLAFYGIVEHTISAATASESTYNQVQDWSEDKGGAAERDSYCLGVSVGLVALSKQEKRNQDELARTNETRALAARIHKENIERQPREEKLRPPHSDELLLMVDQPIDVGGKTLEIDANVELDNIDRLDDDFRFPEDLDASKPDDSLDARKLEASKLKPTSTLESSPAPVSLLLEFSVSQSINKSSEGQMHSSLLSTEAAFPPNGGQNREDAIASGEAATWKTVRQLVTFQEQSAKVAKDWLKREHIRLDKGKKRKKVSKIRKLTFKTNKIVRRFK
ncbi:MAG: hypothetical protein Q9194_001611 [Teloschistes cf. exilis]